MLIVLTLTLTLSDEILQQGRNRDNGVLSDSLSSVSSSKKIIAIYLYAINTCSFDVAIAKKDYFFKIFSLK
jgi:hypothetical protein